MSLTSVRLRLCPQSLTPAVTRSRLNLVFIVETVTNWQRGGDLYFMEMEEGKESTGEGGNGGCLTLHTHVH